MAPAVEVIPEGLMSDQHVPEEASHRADVDDVGQKLDTIAGAVAAIAASHTDLLGHVAEAEARRTQDARSLTQWLHTIHHQTSGDADLLRADMAVSRDELARVTEELATLREQVERIEVAGPLEKSIEELGGRLTLHTDRALAGALRLIDERLAKLRNDLTGVLEAEAVGPSSRIDLAGFEASAVMIAAQAAWNRLEQRLDAEFDDLGRQLQAMAGLIEEAAASADAAANRPVVTADQLRKAASAVKDTVVGAGRSRRDRRGGPRGLGPGAR